MAADARTIWLLYPLIPRVVVWSEDRTTRLCGPGDTLPAPPGFAGLAVAVDDLFRR